MIKIVLTPSYPIRKQLVACAQKRIETAVQAMQEAAGKFKKAPTNWATEQRHIKKNCKRIKCH